MSFIIKPLKAMSSLFYYGKGQRGWVIGELGCLTRVCCKIDLLVKWYRTLN